MEAERKCATCKHWQPGKTPSEMRTLRMALCRHLPRWTFLPPQSCCEKWAQGAASVVAARAAWLA
jgi:hypothetical protein